MKDAEIIAEFERRQTAGNATPQGADHKAILSDVAEMACRPIEDVRELILDNTFARPC